MKKILSFLLSGLIVGSGVAFTATPSDPVGIGSFNSSNIVVPVNTTNPLPVTLSGGGGGSNVNVAIPALGLTDRSGSITTGGTAQQLMGANSSRHGWMCYNSSSADEWINDVGGTALIGGSSFRIIAGALYETPPGGSTLTAISIYGSTTGQTFACREY